MKKNIFKTLAVSFVFASLVLTGCVQNFDGTKPNYSQKKQELTGNSGVNKSAKGLRSWNVSLYGEDGNTLSTIDQASENTWIEVVFEDCEFELDQDSVVKGLSFVKLKNNSANNYYAPEHDGELPKTLIRVEEPTSYSGDVSFYFRVDTRTVETRKIALVVDATKIEYANGSDVISNDGNLKAGEETDSFVKYITISQKADGTQTTQLGSTIGGSHAWEDFAWTWGYNPNSLSKVADLVDSSGKETGAIRFYVYAKNNRANYIDDATYDQSLAETLSKIYTLQTQKPGTTKWVDEKLTFTYHDVASTVATDPYSAHTYTTDVPAMEAGTKWRIVHDSSVSIGNPPAWYQDYYLHPEFKDKRKVITKVAPSSDDYYVVSYANEDTEYICLWSSETFNKDKCSYTYARSAQRSMFTVSCPNNEYILITPKAGVDLATVDGFVLVNANGNGIIETETTVHKNTSDVIDYITIAPKNKNFSGKVKLYVNEKTTLKSNSYNAKQLKFGFYPQPLNNLGELTGHYQLPDESSSSTYTINLRTDTISPGVKQGVPSDITDYSIVYVDDYNEPERWHYLTPGMYQFIFYNGYNDDVGVLAASGLSPNDIAECVIFNLDGTNSHGYDYTKAGSEQTFTIYSAGWYRVKCSNDYRWNNDNKGYLAYCLYQN